MTDDGRCHWFIHQYLSAWMVVLAPWVLWLEQPAKSDPTFDLSEEDEPVCDSAANCEECARPVEEDEEWDKWVLEERRKVWEEGDVFND